METINTILSSQVADRLFIPNDSYVTHNFSKIKVQYYTDLLSGNILRDNRVVVLTEEHKQFIVSEINRLTNISN